LEKYKVENRGEPKPRTSEKQEVKGAVTVY
jgi:hypothetical protein